MEVNSMNYELMENNKVFLKGVVVSKPRFSHEVFGEGFYELDLNVKRLSDNYDIVLVLCDTDRKPHHDFELIRKKINDIFGVQK